MALYGKRKQSSSIMSSAKHSDIKAEALVVHQIEYMPYRIILKQMNWPFTFSNLT